MKRFWCVLSLSIKTLDVPIDSTSLIVSVGSAYSPQPWYVDELGLILNCPKRLITNLWGSTQQYSSCVLGVFNHNHDIIKGIDNRTII